ncbi:hypothetical protein HY745_01035, partial [Candidatus Desantisbacteria bacterium]|nr:hypothetical protein [Candidatus Desantisbacteria bacterium]
MGKKIKKCIICLSILLIFYSVFTQVYLHAESVTGKVIWVSPFFGLIYIRLDNEKTASLDSKLEIYLKTNGKTGKISSISAYRDVTICKIEPPEL